jgi:hypothetical protein
MAVWGQFKWGVRRFWEQYSPIFGATVTISTSQVTVATISHIVEGGSTMPEYVVGNVLKLAANFKNGSTDVDPGSIVLKIKSPLGTIQTYTYGDDADLVKDSTGDYSFNYSPAYEGRYSFRWAGLGTNASAAESSFVVTESQFN